MLVKKSIEEFCEVLGSDAPAPRGGSVAALSGALGAELVSMACQLSISRREYEEYTDLLKSTLNESIALAKSLLKRVDSNAEAFNSVMVALKMPKSTDEEKKARTAAIQKNYKEAVQSPLSIARECREVLRLVHKIVGKSNASALSDLGVASQQAIAGLEGAIMNIEINLPPIKDEAFKEKTLSEISSLLEYGRQLKHNVYKYVFNHI
jgi:formiminotetrahydrofolate cyclodeaminase